VASMITLEGSVTGTDPVSGAEPMLGAGREGVVPVAGCCATDGSELVSGSDTDGSEAEDRTLEGTRGSDPSPVSASVEVLGPTKVCGAAAGTGPAKAR